MNKRGWAILAGAVTAAIVLVGALWIGGSGISAQGPGTNPLRQGCGEGECDCGLSLREAAQWGFRAYGQADIVAEQLGLTVDELMAAIRGGQSVADLAAEQGVALDTIVEALVTAQHEALAVAVAEGRITSEQADALLARMQENIVARLEQPGPRMGQSPAGRMMRAQQAGWQMHGQLDLAAETLGLTVDDLVAALRDGQTMAQVAEAQGVTLDTLVEALLAPRRATLAEKVAAGELTQTEADELLTRMRETMTTRLQQNWQPGGMGMSRMGGGRMGGGRMGGGRLDGGRLDGGPLGGGGRMGGGRMGGGACGDN